jgi:protein-S-isoprenylcysteine O-methyltransferase Ste14
MKPASVAMGTLFLGSVFVLGPMGMVALNEAWEWPRWQTGIGRMAGGALLVGGLAVAVYCSNLFARVGRGTPVPIEPPKHLVITGLYRYCRNPIYLGHMAFLFGLFLYRGELLLLFYAGHYCLAAHAWVVWLEEPGLRHRFGEPYVRYMQEVPRWIPVRPRTDTR